MRFVMRSGSGGLDGWSDTPCIGQADAFAEMGRLRVTVRQEELVASMGWIPCGMGRRRICLYAGDIARSLPPLAKKYALQLLFIDSPISAKTMEGWVLTNGISKHRVAIDRLMQLRVFLEEIDSDNSFDIDKMLE
ncbi:hypothetical protein QJS10_CPB15g00891 [Acorus calamus]|uniref:RNA polymerase II transcription factor B subunit 2 n=1 Tax=Acorus calamus TaxID=4465 RepID=A0AAV9D6K5_ACOCL|nr:hypothetical protein QJS10_CPB15g00891 [Acorus calamus]